MAYSKAYEKDGLWVREVAEGTLKRGLKTVVGLHAYDGGTGPSLQGDIAALDSAAIDGICLFRWGAFALAFAEERQLSPPNTHASPITAIQPGTEGSIMTLDSAIAPGEERRITLPSKPETVRAFTADAEVCVHLLH